MGKHYVPQEYLRGFSVLRHPDSIWQFDKSHLRYTTEPAAIKRVAQQSDFYDDATEEQLARRVEKPGNKVLRQLRSGNFHLSNSDRYDLAQYIATLMMRVVAKREFSNEMIPDAVNETVDGLANQIEASVKNGTLEKQHAEEGLCRLIHIRERFLDHPPKQLVEAVQNPWATERIVFAFLLMPWRFVLCSGEDFFITSDNPVFLFEGLGLINEDSQFSLPLSNQLCLLGQWDAPSMPNALKARRQIVKEVNRRTVFGALRFIYSSRKVQWVATVAKKDQPFLSRIRWI